MKKTLLIWVLIAFIPSCTSGHSVNIDSSDTKHSNGLATWQAQLEHAMNLDKLKTKTRIDDIRLVGYVYKGKIESATEMSRVVNQILSDESDIVVYPNKSEFEIVPIGKAIRDMKLLKAENIEWLKIQFQQIPIGVELLKLEWDYKGKTHYSLAIVSNNYGGVIYDNIGHLILEPTNVDIKTSKGSHPILKTRTEVQEQNTIITSTLFEKPKNGFGIEVADITFKASSTFKKGILFDRNLSSSYSTAIGYSCAASIRTVSGDLDVSTYHEWAWGYDCVFGGSASLSWNGIGFTIGGNGIGKTKTETHRP